MAGYFTACCNEISRCCYDFYHAPFTKKNLLIIGGVIIGIIILVIIIVASTGHSTPNTPNSNNDLLSLYPLVDGYNNFSSTLKVIAGDVLHGSGVPDLCNNEDMTKYCANINATYKFCQTDFIKLKAGKVSTQVWVANVDCNAQYKDVVSRTLAQIDVIKRLINLPTTPKSSLISEANDIKLGGGQTIGGIIAIGGGHQLDMRTSNVRMYYDLGVRMIALGSPECIPTEMFNSNGLTDFGKTMIKQMNYQGIIMDLSGLTSNQMISVLSATQAPVVFSHSCPSRQNNNKNYNIDSNIIELLNSNKDKMPYELSIMMITLNPNQLADCLDMTNITEISMKDVVGLIRNLRTDDSYKNIKLGIGSAFDTSNNVTKGLEDVSKFPSLFDAMKDLPNSFLTGLAGQNFKNMFNKVQEVSQKLQKDSKSDFLSSLEQMVPLNDLNNSDTKTCYTEPWYTGKVPPSKPTTATTTITTTTTKKTNTTA